MLASRISANPAIREFLLELQRSLAEENSVVMDGRDIGTVVLPNADVKIFLTAKPEERAKRRYDELIEKGLTPEFKDVLADLNRRDYDDSHRLHAPLKQAEDAVLLDTTGNTFEKSVREILGIINDN
jgi:cytidylate kinase